MATDEKIVIRMGKVLRFFFFESFKQTSGGLATGEFTVANTVARRHRAPMNLTVKNTFWRSKLNFEIFLKIKQFFDNYRRRPMITTALEDSKFHGKHTNSDGTR